MRDADNRGRFFDAPGMREARSEEPAGPPSCVGKGPCTKERAEFLGRPRRFACEQVAQAGESYAGIWVMA